VKVLVDADTLAYRVAYSKEVSDPTSAIRKTDEEVSRIKEAVNPYLDNENYQFYLTGKGNFRFDYDATYKGNRKSEKPVLLPVARDHLVEAYGAVVTEGQEADDAISIEARNYDWHDVVVVSIDKDLRQIPCQLYNPGRNTWESIDPWTAKVNFYEQLLVGDLTDNVVGIYKVGPVKAKKMLDGATTEYDLWKICADAYGDYEKAVSNARMLHLRVQTDEIWEPPND
jgi:DNA polymerase I